MNAVFHLSAILRLLDQGVALTVSAARLSLIGAALILPHQSSAATAPDFLKQVQPILEKSCFKCHGPEKQKGGLRFDRMEGAMKAGESGELAIIPGKAAESRVIKLISSQKEDEWMPPKGDRLSETEVGLLRQWIDAGAAWPEAGASTGKLARAEMVVTDADRKHWSYLPLRSPALPAVHSTALVRSPVDRFILAKLEEKKLRLPTVADPRKLVRRIYYDLIGLPPSPEQVQTFIEQFARNDRLAVTRLVDELLASPRHGERWARHWLDVARYADSDGQESDADRPTAYHYRDFVIRSLNEDRPFDTFVRWQLAGDELEPDRPDAIAATGFIAAGTHAALPANLMEEERMRERFNELDDMIATTGSAMLGLTLACARCHDHKYDPVPRRDYYRMLSAFNSGDRAEVPLVSPAEVQLQREKEAKWKAEFEPAQKRIAQLLKAGRKTHEANARELRINALPITEDEKKLLRTRADGKEQSELAKKYSKELTIGDRDIRALLKEKETAELLLAENTLKEIEARKPKALPMAFGFADFGPAPREAFLLARGDFHAKSEPVQLGFLTALSRGKSPEQYWAVARAQSKRSDSTQQRRAMAEWMTDMEQGAGPLVARVIVNRVWQHHFGEGLIRTVNDFGIRADPPAHPELLEWLTSEFVKSGWKLKHLHRLILTSSVYLQGAHSDSESSRIDPENRLLWRRQPLRVEAEVLRDAILTVSGKLNRRMFGKAVKEPIAPEAIQARNMKDPYPKDIQDGPTTWRRSVYIFHKRVVQSPMMQAFDGPDAQASCGRRQNTTVAPQALALLNDRFIRARAADFAKRIEGEAGSEPDDQVMAAWKLALARVPNSDEARAGVAFIQSQTERRSEREPKDAKERARSLALVDFCQAIFGLNEFIYVD